MSPRLVPTRRLSFLLAAAMALPLAHGEILAWSSLKTSPDPGSTLVAIETDTTVLGTRNFAVGSAQGRFRFDTSPPIELGSHRAGIVVGGKLDSLTDDFGADWIAYATSDSGEVAIHDLVVLPGTGTLAVCGTTHGDTSLFLQENSGPPLLIDTFSAASGGTGFLATLDPESGRWLSIAATPGILPHHIGADDATSVVVSGPGTLAARFALDGSLLWNQPAPADASERRALAVKPGRPVFAACDVDDGGADDANLILRRLNPQDGSIVWTRTASGPGREKIQLLEWGGTGGLIVIFEGDRANSRWAGNRIFDEFRKAEHDRTLIGVEIRDPGYEGWKTQLGGAFNTGDAPSIEALAGAGCEDGSLNLAVRLNGDWIHERNDEPRSYRNETVVFRFSPGGMVDHFETDTEGMNLRGLHCRNDESLMVVGEFDSPTQAFVGGLAFIRTPFRYSLSIDFDLPLNLLGIVQLRSLVAGVGGIIYSEVNAPGGPEPVVAITFDADIAAAQLLRDIPGVVLEREAKLKQSATDDPFQSWALSMVAAGATSGVYAAPSTTGPTRLYLIDSSVSFLGGWIDDSPTFVIGSQQLIRGSNDPMVIADDNHGTASLSLVADSWVGLAPSTPIEFHGYDVFPEPDSTSASLIAKAVIEAVQHQRAHPDRPGVICLAISSETAASSYLLERSIDAALAEGIAVFVSAGNHGHNASQFIPAAYGEKEGVICVGAHEQDGSTSYFSNTGPAVDLLAPGSAVPALEPASNGFAYIVDTTGTSPATALAAGAGLLQLSASPGLSPAALESALKQAAAPGSGGQPAHLRLTVGASVTEPIVENPDPYANIDPTARTIGGESDEEIQARLGIELPTLPAATEVILASGDAAGFTIVPDPLSSRSGTALPAAAALFHGLPPGETLTKEITHDPEAGTLSFRFPVATALFDATTPFELLNGTRWRLLCSENGTDWTAPIGTLSTSLDSTGQLQVTATIPEPSGTSCLLVVEILP